MTATNAAHRASASCITIFGNRRAARYLSAQHDLQRALAGTVTTVQLSFELPSNDGRGVR